MYRPHRSHARYAAVAAPMMRSRRRPAAAAGFVPLPAPRASTPSVLVGMLYAAPLGVALWAAIILAIRAFF